MTVRPSAGSTTNDARYDIYGDGQVTVRDAIAAVPQLGRRCYPRARCNSAS